MERETSISHINIVFSWKIFIVKSSCWWFYQANQFSNWTNVRTVFVWLFWVYRPTRECFTQMEMSPLPVKTAIFTYARHSWPLSSEGSLTCHTYCDTGLRFIMVISEDPWHAHLLPVEPHKFSKKLN